MIEWCIYIFNNSNPGVSGTNPELDNLYLMLDQQLHPIPPDNTCPQSVQIFEEHKQVTKLYIFFKLFKRGI